MATNTSEIAEGANPTVSDMSPTDHVIKFLLENQIQRGVIDEILERGFDSLQALSLMDAEDIKSQRIPVGQRRLLVHLAKSLGTSVTVNTTTLEGVGHSAGANSTSLTADTQQAATNNVDVYNQTLINTLLAQQSQVAVAQTSVANTESNIQNSENNSVNSAGNANSPGNSNSDPLQPTWRDPQIHIATATGKSASLHYDICDFVPHAVEEELVIGGQGDQQVVVKSGPKKPKLENLSLSQWSIANMAILYKLVGEGKLVGPALMDYLSYTTKFYQLIQKCNLTSVLLYDREYRQLQASMGFRWGTDVQHLHTLHLQTRDRQVKQGSQSQAPKKGGNGQSQGAKQRPDKRDMGICRNFNSPKGCTFSQCKFLHQCILPGCGQKHSGTTHLEKN